MTNGVEQSHRRVFIWLFSFLNIVQTILKFISNDKTDINSENIIFSRYSEYLSAAILLIKLIKYLGGVS